MMPNSLQAVLDRQKKQKPPETKPKQRQRKAAVSTPSPDKRQKPSRKGTRLIGGHFPPDVAKQLRILAAEEETTVQELLSEALHDLFVKKGKKAIV